MIKETGECSLNENSMNWLIAEMFFSTLGSYSNYHVQCYFIWHLLKNCIVQVINRVPRNYSCHAANYKNPHVSGLLCILAVIHIYCKWYPKKKKQLNNHPSLEQILQIILSEGSFLPVHFLSFGKEHTASVIIYNGGSPSCLLDGLRQECPMFQASRNNLERLLENISGKKQREKMHTKLH